MVAVRVWTTAGETAWSERGAFEIALIHRTTGSLG